VSWQKVQAHNNWYIDEDFLLKGMTLHNPTRLSEAIVKAYWGHWYDLAQEGQHFCFKTAKDYQEPKDGSDLDDNMEVEKPSGGGTSGDEQQEGSERTPKNCKSEEEKIAFLRALLPQSENKYHAVVTAVALLEVGVYLVVGYHLLILQCYFLE